MAHWYAVCMSTQLALRLPNDLLGDLDWLVVRCRYENRTEAMRDALVQLVRAERQRHIDEQIVAGYTKNPQTAAELIGIDDQPSFLDDGDDWSDLL